MRKVVAEHSFLGSTDIGAIELDAKSRNAIPVLLIGLQAIYMNDETRAELFRLLDEHIPPGKCRGTDHPGLNLWRILVMGLLKQGLRCDFVHLQEIVNRHLDVHAFLGHDAWFDPYYFELQTIQDNVGLLTPELIRKVRDLVATIDQKIVRKRAWRTVCRSL